ncbi:MAG: aspartate carbamoyltransferase regulatory subunit [Candidatus Hodarchaeota archaeon]
MAEELRVRKIRNGTVIDHISAGSALDVLSILGVTGKEGYTISIVLNVPSTMLGKKDIVKIEDRTLDSREVDMIAIVSPEATINIVKNYRVVDKKPVVLPATIKRHIRCINPNCISNGSEPIVSVLDVVKKTPLQLRCRYCNQMIEKRQILNLLGYYT